MVKRHSDRSNMGGTSQDGEKLNIMAFLPITYWVFWNISNLLTWLEMTICVNKPEATDIMQLFEQIWWCKSVFPKLCSGVFADRNLLVRQNQLIPQSTYHGNVFACLCRTLASNYRLKWNHWKTSDVVCETTVWK